MDIFTIPPFTSGSVVWQEQPEQWTLTLVCKITYSLVPGTATVAHEQEAINEQDNHWDDDLERSVYAPSDHAPYKPRPEVLLVGSTFAPRGEPVRSLFARLIVGSVDKSVEVFGSRWLSIDGVLTEGPRFTKMALRYERARGGEGSWNPVGVDPTQVDPYGKRTLPNLQPPGLHEVGDGASIETTGFGPLASRWAIRRDKLGPLTSAFASGVWTETPLGMDFDGSFFQSAPQDQCLEELRPDEHLVLENLHPQTERISTRLPGIKPRTRVEIEGMPPWELDLVPDTLWIDTDRAICTLTFRGQLPLDGRHQPGRIFIGIERPQEPVQFPEPPGETAHAESSDEADEIELTYADNQALKTTGKHPLPFATNPALPFSRGAAVLPPSAPVSSAPRARRTPGDPDETSVFVAPTAAARGRMPTWLEGKPVEPAPNVSAAPPMAPPPLPATPIAAAPPSAPGLVPAPPPPVSQMLRSSEPAPFNVVTASNRAASVEPVASPSQGMPPIMQVPPLRPMAAPLPGIVVPPHAPAAPPVPPVPPLPGARASQPGTTVGQAAVLGAAEASNAAAMRADETPEPEKKAQSTATQPDKAPGRMLIDFLWFAPELPPRLPENAAWKRILEPEPEPKEPEPERREIPDEEWSPDAPQRPSRKKAEKEAPKTPEEKAKDEKSRVSKVLSRAQPTLDVENALFAAINDDGVLEPPLAVVSGELEIPFDEVETLKVLCSAAAPLGGTDKKLKETLDLANEALGTPLGSSPEVAANFSVRVREAWVKANKYFAPDYLDIHTKRVLLEQRKYQMRKLVGESWIRALLVAPMTDKPVPTYLPADLKEKLPLFLRFSARLIVEILPQQDQNEAHSVALRALALARTVTAKPRR